MVPLPLRTLIVDDHNMFRQALVALLKTRPDIVTVIGEAADSCGALELARELQPDLVLLDVMMPDCSGTDTARDLREIVPGAKIIMLSASSEMEHIREAITAGADGYLTKSLSAKRLFEMLQEAAQDRIVITPDIAAELFKEVASMAEPADADVSLDALGPLDTAISQLVAAGATNTQIAKELGISTHTVRSHLSHILRALKLENRTQLAVYIKAQQP